MSRQKSDYTLFDLPEVTRFLFHPRKEMGMSSGIYPFKDLLIPVADNVEIGARFYACDKRGPVLLYFHGNGEIVEDYDDFSQLYMRMNVNFLPVDYRGYGKSTGEPNVSSMMTDCHEIFHYVRNWLAEQGYSGAVICMGRSLGSASVLEIVSNYSDKVDGLIIESGFAFALPLLRLLGIDTERLGVTEEGSFENYNKISAFNRPTLVIHAENDHIIPFSDGQKLFENAADPEKQFLKIPGANHNDILAKGLQDYMYAVKNLIERAILQKSGRESAGG